VFLGSEQYPYKGLTCGYISKCKECSIQSQIAALQKAQMLGQIQIILYIYHLTHADDRHTQSQQWAKKPSFKSSPFTLTIFSTQQCPFSTVRADHSTSSGCLTEVHHINGEGKDAGVVYSEMQGRQNQSGDLMELEMQRLVFPEGCGYRSETGGLMEALRVLDVQTIREYFPTPPYQDGDQC
jgi:hypothetical protein